MNRDKFIELFLNEIGSSDDNYQKAKKCYAIASKMVLGEINGEFTGFLTTDREQFWKKEVNKYGNNEIK